MTMRVARVPHVIQCDEAAMRQEALPGFRRPDMFWRTNVLSAEGRVLRERLLACARGRRGSGERLLAALRSLSAPRGISRRVVGTVPDACDAVSVGWATEPGSRTRIIGWLIWFGEPPQGSLPCPAATPEIRKDDLFSAP
jgi:hypothetical protein